MHHPSTICLCVSSFIAHIICVCIFGRRWCRSAAATAGGEHATAPAKTHATAPQQHQQPQQPQRPTHTGGGGFQRFHARREERILPLSQPLPVPSPQQHQQHSS